jgi:hypothetical protein
MRNRSLLVGGSILAVAAAAPARGQESLFARIAFVRPKGGQTAAFENGYMRHLEWHRQAGDPWRWYGWTIWAGERQRWFAYATFGHSSTEFDHPVSPLDDERDTEIDLEQHLEWEGSGLYRFLPTASRGTGEPQAAARLEFTMVEVRPEATADFEAALVGARNSLSTETLWYRMLAGGTDTRYVRLRSVPSVSAAIEQHVSEPLPDAAARLATRTVVELWNFRPTLSYRAPTQP